MKPGLRAARWRLGRAIAAAGGCVLAACTGVNAAEPARWAGQDLAGQAVVVPAEGAATVMVFVRPGQSQSGQLLGELRELLGTGVGPAAEGVEVVVVVSGKHAAEQAGALGEAASGWSVVADTDYALSGQLGVHVWPMTVLLNGQGEEQARLGGLPRSFTADLRPHLEYVSGQIDEQTLQARLAVREVVADENGPAKRLQMAEQLLHRGQTEAARAALQPAIEQLGDEPGVQVRAARLLTMVGEPGEAIALLDGIPAGVLPGWQVNTVRARALIQLDEWDQAREVLPEAMRLNPNPGEVHYLQGLLQEHEGDWAAAARSYRAAFEATAPTLKVEQ